MFPKLVCIILNIMHLPSFWITINVRINLIEKSVWQQVCITVWQVFCFLIIITMICSQLVMYRFIRLWCFTGCPWSEWSQVKTTFPIFFFKWNLLKIIYQKLFYKLLKQNIGAIKVKCYKRFLKFTDQILSLVWKIQA